MKLRKYTEEQLREAIRSSNSLAQALTKLGVAPYGGNYVVLRKALKVFDISTSHFTGQGWSKGKILGPSRPIIDYFNGVGIASHTLRLRLLKEKIFKHQCSSCGRKTWLKRPVPLELDHINGDRENNSLGNLRLLCPNCHAFTSTYRGKNKRSQFRSVLPSA